MCIPNIHGISQFSAIRYYNFRILKTNGRHLGIPLSVSILTYLTSLPCHFISAYHSEHRCCLKEGSKNAKQPFSMHLIYLKKVCYRVSLSKNCSDEVVRHSLAYLYVRKWLVGDAPFNVQIWRILNHSIANRRFSIFARSAPAVIGTDIGDLEWPWIAQ